MRIKLARWVCRCVAGKQCFFVIRQNCYTIQALLYVTENISKQMVKFAAK